MPGMAPCSIAAISLASPVAAPMTGPRSCGLSPRGMVSCAMLLPSEALTFEFMIALTTAVPTEPPRARTERTMAVLVAMSEEGACAEVNEAFQSVLLIQKLNCLWDSPRIVQQRSGKSAAGRIRSQPACSLLLRDLYCQSWIACYGSGMIVGHFSIAREQ